MNNLRIAFAGDRDIAVWVLDFILSRQVRPLALLVPGTGKASHARELIARCTFLSPERVLIGKQFREPEGIDALRRLELDYVIGVHFPYIVPEAVLAIPRFGVLNLHPAYLPYNRGWHTPSWALLEESPIGATLHYMDTGVDSGDIVHQKLARVSPGDTANTLYQRLKELELETFEEAWPQLAARAVRRQPQNPAEGTFHKRQELFTEHVQKIDLDEQVKVGDLLRRLRALTTNRVDEAAYYEADGRRYRIQVQVHEEPQP